MGRRKRNASLLPFVYIYIYIYMMPDNAKMNCIVKLSIKNGLSKKKKKTKQTVKR